MKTDPRGLRVVAGITTCVLIAVLITGSGWLLGFQTVVFAVGAFAGLRYAPYGYLYRVLVRPRLGPPPFMEDAAPPRFAQGVGFVFGAAGTAGYAAGVAPLGMAFTAAALVAAFLNAAFGLCLGCEMYVLIRRIWPAHRGDAPVLNKGGTA
jgi:hypothetical protein